MTRAVDGAVVGSLAISDAVHAVSAEGVDAESSNGVVRVHTSPIKYINLKNIEFGKWLFTIHALVISEILSHSLNIEPKFLFLFSFLGILKKIHIFLAKE